MALFKNFFKFFYYGPVSLGCGGLIDAAVMRIIIYAVAVFVDGFIEFILFFGQAPPAVIKSVVMPAEDLSGASDIYFSSFCAEPLAVFSVIERDMPSGLGVIVVVFKSVELLQNADPFFTDLNTRDLRRSALRQKY